MFEKVNPSHPDKIADRIAGAMVDLAYKKEDRPKVAVEVLIGHDKCHIIAESSIHFSLDEITKIVDRIVGDSCEIDYYEVPQDEYLAYNQEGQIRCGDNGIFKGVVPSDCEAILSSMVRKLYKKYPTDGKFIYDEESRVVIACQSNGLTREIDRDIRRLLNDEIEHPITIVNPLGDWTGGINVDSGATNRKLGSDMGRAVTGGGLHGKDLSKADVSISIACHLLAKKFNAEVESFVPIGFGEVKFRIFNDLERFEPVCKSYDEVVKMARKYVNKIGGFERLAEWGLV